MVFKKIRKSLLNLSCTLYLQIDPKYQHHAQYTDFKLWRRTSLITDDMWLQAFST